MKCFGKIKSGIALASAAALTVGMFPATAFAAISYDAPSQGMEADDETYLSGATAAANTVVLSLLGINVTSSDAAGMYSADAVNGASSDNYGTDSSNLGIFGSDINDNLDPYIYNFFYNLNSTQSGGGTYDADDYSAWTATPYALIWGSNKSGPSGQASGTVTISVGGVTKTTNPAFFYEPDILLGGGSNGYATELANYQADYNEDYDPLVFLGYGTGSGNYAASGSRSDGLGLEYNQFDMTTGVVYLGSVLQNMMNETGKVNRYDQGTYEIAVDYDKYDRGLYYYVLSEIADGCLTQVRYSSSLSYDADTGFTVSEGTDRKSQYASGIGVDIYDLLEDGYVFSDGTVVEATTQSSSGGQGGPGGGSSSASTVYVLTTDQIIEILNAPTAENEYATGVMLGSAVDTDDNDLAEAGIRFLSNLPSCVYGMTMQTVENGMGIPFYIGYFYYDQDNDLNPISYIYYWMEHFYHVSDNDAMDTVINNMLEDASLPDQLQLAGAHAANYSSSLIEEQITIGIDYYTDVLEPAYDADDSIDSDSALYWTSLDTTVGIGSDIRDTNVNYNCTSGESFTDSFGNEIYSFTYTEAVDTPDILAVRRIANNGTCTFYISYSNDSETADVKFIYGKSTDEVLVGDWDGDGVDTIAVRRGNTYYFLNVASEDIVSGESYVADAELTYGKSTDEVLVGDWDGDGKDTLCVRRGSEYYFSNDLTSTRGTQVSIGSGSETALAGDWDGDGADTVCLNSGNVFTVYDASGTAGDSYTYGSAKKTYDGVLAGDWDADGVDTICLRLGNTYYFTNSASGASTSSELAYGKSMDEVFAGAWK